MHAVPDSFNDTVTAIKTRLKECMTCDYILYTESLGNCFGPSLSAYAKLNWKDGRNAYYRCIKAEYGKISDKTIIRDNSALFNYFLTNHIDTIATLPKSGWIMEPPSICEVIVKEGAISYLKRFEYTPFFTTHDTCHPLFKFVSMAIK